MTIGRTARRYGGWLKRRLLNRPRSRVGTGALIERLRARQPPLPGFGLDVAALRERFAAISIDGSEPGGLAGYARQDLERFLRTVDLVPEDAERGLEIGANPYFTTMLLTWLRPKLELATTNYFGDPEGHVGIQTVTMEGPQAIETRRFTYHSVNVETQRLPYDDASFDTVLFCEVLEHMTNDPVAALSEIARVLRPGGRLVLTTPNAARLENVGRVVVGLNIADQYSGYGPYGRHNREYTAPEVAALLAHCGFVQEIAYTADVYPNHGAIYALNPRQLAMLADQRADLLGQYIFSRWTRSEAAHAGRPSWLYRSLPMGETSDAVPLTEPAGTSIEQ